MENEELAKLELIAKARADREAHAAADALKE